MPRKARPRQSRLSLQTRLKHLEDENEGFREALEQIADILEDVGILEGDGEEEGSDPENDPSNFIEPEEVQVLNKLDAEEAEETGGT